MEMYACKDSDLDQVVIFCQPCQLEDYFIQAERFCETCNEYLCSTCLKVHRKLAISRNHMIKLKDDMPEVPVPGDSCLHLCDHSTSEIVKLYCKEHDTVGCGECMVLNHKPCTVKPVPEVSGNYVNSEERRRIFKELEELMVDLSTTKADVNYDIKTADRYGKEAVEQIKKVRQDVNGYLDKAEAAILVEIEHIRSKCKASVNMMLQKLGAMGTDLQRLQTEIGENSNRINQLFVSGKIAQKMLKERQEEVESIISGCEILCMKFEPSGDLIKLIANTPTIGKITVEKGALQRHRKKSIVDKEARLVKTMATKSNEDRNVQGITGLAMTSQDELVLADYNNKSLKIVNVIQNKITSRYVTPVGPWDVSAITDGIIATTLMDSGTLLFMNTKGGLSKSHEIKVEKNCKGIDHKNGMIAISCINPASVLVLNMKGTVVYEFEVSFRDYPDYIALGNDCGVIYLSDWYKNEIYEVSIDGHLKTTVKHKDINSLQGLAVTSDGTVIVCCDSNREKLIMFVPSTGDILPLEVKDVFKPQSIVVCESQNRLFISDFSENTDVKVIGLK